MLKIEQLSKSHNRKAFDCGNVSLNTYIQKQARQHSNKGISRTFVVVDYETDKEILGYYTLTVCEVIPSDIPDLKLQKYPHPIPAAKLARLAISKSRQKQGLGKLLMIDAMQRALAISQNAGLVGMFVDAKDEAAVEFYQQFQFVTLDDNPNFLFLPMGTIFQLLS